MSLGIKLLALSVAASGFLVVVTPNEAGFYVVRHEREPLSYARRRCTLRGSHREQARLDRSYYRSTSRRSAVMGAPKVGRPRFAGGALFRSKQVPRSRRA